MHCRHEHKALSYSYLAQISVKNLISQMDLPLLLAVKVEKKNLRAKAAVLKNDRAINITANTQAQLPLEVL